MPLLPVPRRRILVRKPHSWVTGLEQGHGRADRGSAVADGVPAAAVRPRAEPGRAGVGAPEAVAGQPDQARHHRAHRAGEDPTETDAVPPSLLEGFLAGTGLDLSPV